MSRYRAILSGILAIVMVFMVSCGSPTATKAPVYTQAQIEQIQQYQSKLLALRDRLTELESLIQKRDWNNVNSLLHGPLGSLRPAIGYLSTQLLPKDKQKALEIAGDLLGHIESIDQADATGDYETALTNYQEALKDFDAFVQLLPSS